MNTVRFVKSFNKGQITIPKEFRNSFGIVNEFWLKLYIQNGKLIGEPVEIEKNGSDYIQKLQDIKGEWFSPKEYKKTRIGVDRRMRKSSASV